MPGFGFPVLLQERKSVSLARSWVQRFHSLTIAMSRLSSRDGMKLRLSPLVVRSSPDRLSSCRQARNMRCAYDENHR